MSTTKSIPISPTEIRAALFQKGQTVAAFARKHKFNIHTVRATIYGTRTGSPEVAKIQNKLEEVLGE